MVKLIYLAEFATFENLGLDCITRQNLKTQRKGRKRAFAG